MEEYQSAGPWVSRGKGWMETKHTSGAAFGMLYPSASPKPLSSADIHEVQEIHPGFQAFIAFSNSTCCWQNGPSGRFPQQAQQRHEKVPCLPYYVNKVT
jgi:hypothetical protein